MTSDNYPESMGLMFVVNAPWAFSAVWSICKSFVDERTQKKIQIMNTGYEKKLLEVIDAENLPAFLGGTCTCASSGGCEHSDAGPWQDYVMVAPFGARHKNEAALEVAAQVPAQVIEESKEPILEAKAEAVEAQAVAVNEQQQTTQKTEEAVAAAETAADQTVEPATDHAQKAQHAEAHQNDP